MAFFMQTEVAWLPERYLCLNLYPCVIKLSQSVSLSVAEDAMLGLNVRRDHIQCVRDRGEEGGDGAKGGERGRVPMSSPPHAKTGNIECNLQRH